MNANAVAIDSSGNVPIPGTLTVAPPKVPEIAKPKRIREWQLTACQLSRNYGSLQYERAELNGRSDT
jgi:hypothetical protein